MYRKRPQPGLKLSAAPADPLPPPPFNPQETADEIQCWSTMIEAPPAAPHSGRSFLKRTFIVLLAVGFTLLAMYLFFHLVQTLSIILAWPAWAALPVLLLLGLLLSYLVLRLVKLWFLIRKLPRIPPLDSQTIAGLKARDREELRKFLLPQLKHLLATRPGRSEELLEKAESLLASAADSPSDAWLTDYRSEILRPLAGRAREEVWQIATVAGVSAALSPWKLLDAFIAFNAAVEAGGKVLSSFGFQPNSAMATTFAFDTFLSTFFAAAFEEIADDIAQDAAERISSELGSKATEILAPKMAQGLAVTFFVRRLGRRMIRKLAPQ